MDEHKHPLFDAREHSSFCCLNCCGARRSFSMTFDDDAKGHKHADDQVFFLFFSFSFFFFLFSFFSFLFSFFSFLYLSLNSILFSFLFFYLFPIPSPSPTLSSPSPPSVPSHGNGKTLSWTMVLLSLFLLSSRSHYLLSSPTFGNSDGDVLVVCSYS